MAVTVAVADLDGLEVDSLSDEEASEEEEKSFNGLETGTLF